MSIVKAKVCATCFSPDIVDSDCVCVWDKNYPTIELEFEFCDCCGRLSTDAIESEFNSQQYEKYNP